MGIKEHWVVNYRNVQDIVRTRWKPEAEKVFVAFNANIDTVHRLSEKNLARAIRAAGEKEIFSKAKSPPEKIETAGDFLSNMAYAIKTSGAREIVCKNPDVAAWAEKVFPPNEARVGGQAGIMANFLSRLGIEVVLYTPLLSKKQASLFEKDVMCPALRGGKVSVVPAKNAVNSDMTKTNRIFEFKEGFRLGSSASGRANRFILASRPKGTEPLFPSSFEPHFADIFKGVDRAIFSGYQSEKVGHKRHFSKAAREIKKIRKAQPNLLIHLEEAFVSSAGLEEEILEYIAKNVHSIGMNEVEARQVASCVLGRAPKGNSLEELYIAGAAIAKKLDLLRVHIHYLGYYLAVVDKKYPVSPERVRNSLLFASLAAEARAETGALPSVGDICSEKIRGISDAGIRELEKLRENMGLCRGFVESGICDMGGHYLIAVPTILFGRPKTTVGMGDVISSSAFAGELL